MVREENFLTIIFLTKMYPLLPTPAILDLWDRGDYPRIQLSRNTFHGVDFFAIPTAYYQLGEFFLIDGVRITYYRKTGGNLTLKVAPGPVFSVNDSGWSTTPEQAFSEGAPGLKNPLGFYFPIREAPFQALMTGYSARRKGEPLISPLSLRCMLSPGPVEVGGFVRVEYKGKQYDAIVYKKGELYDLYYPGDDTVEWGVSPERIVRTREASSQIEKSLGALFARGEITLRLD